MKKSLILLCAAMVFVSSAGIAKATLTVYDFSGTKVTYDSSTGNYWYWDIDQFSSQSYSEQITSIANLIVAGLAGTWRMADHIEMQGLWNNPVDSIAYNFNHSYSWQNVSDGTTWKEWQGRYERISTLGDHHYGLFGWNGTNQSYYDYGLDYEIYDSYSHPNFGAWVILYGNPTPIPEPATSLLFGIGLIGLAGVRRKTKR